MNYNTFVSDYDTGEDKEKSDIYDELRRTLFSSPIGSFRIETTLRDEELDPLYEKALILVTGVAQDIKGNTVLFFDQGTVTILKG